MGVPRTSWSKEELKALKKFYPLLGTKVTKADLEKLFINRTWRGIQQRASELGLKCGQGGVNVDFQRQLEKAVRSI